MVCAACTLFSYMCCAVDVCIFVTIRPWSALGAHRDDNDETADSHRIPRILYTITRHPNEMNNIVDNIYCCAIDFVRMPSISSINSTSTCKLFFFAVKFFFLYLRLVAQPKRSKKKTDLVLVDRSIDLTRLLKAITKSSAIRTKSNPHAESDVFRFICLFSLFSTAWTLQLNATMSAAVTFAKWNAKPKPNKTRKQMKKRRSARRLHLFYILNKHVHCVHASL